MAHAFDKGKINNLELKNRLVMAPMCMYQADDTGMVTPWHFVHYVTRASGGVGLILLEATAVEPRGRISSRDLGIWSDEHVSGLKSIVNEVHKYGAKIGIQLAHAGRKCGVVDESIIAPSSLQFSDRYNIPHEMTDSDIKEVIASFQHAARRAREAGFDVIEIHGAHGYLINQFISPLTNHRQDEYGGNLENRLRFLKEIIAAVKQEWDGPLLVRLSAEEYDPNGHHIEETIQVVQAIVSDIDAFHISTGGVVLTPVESYPGYQIPYAEAIKKQCGVTTIGGGLITTTQQIEDIIRNDRSDFVYLGRVLLRDPYFVLKAAQALGRNEVIPKPYERGF